MVAVYDPATRSLSWAQAGHLPPLLARGGTTAELDRPAGMLLGADADSTYPVVTPRLRGGDLLLFYTDGLVERRVGDTVDLLGPVMRTLSDISRDPDARTLPRLRDVLHQPSPEDDTCTLAVRVLR